MSRSDRLTPRQERFASEFLIDCNASAAARRAGYSPKTADRIGSRQLKNVEVRKVIDAGIERQAERTGIKSDAVLQALAEGAFGDITEAYDDQGNPLPLRRLKPSLRRAISSVESVSIPGSKGSVRRLRFIDKIRCLELLAKHLGLLVDKVEVSGTIGLASRLQQARERVAERERQSEG